MQPSPMAEASSPLPPSVRVFIASLLYPKVERAISVVLPRDPPVFVGARRLHDQLSARQLEQARQVLADEAPDQRTLDVKRELARGFVDLVSAERGLVPGLRILHRPRGRPCLRISVHDLDRHAALAREDEQPRAVRAVNCTVSTLLFEPDEP